MRETKDEHFHRVAEARVNKLIKMLRLLGNCSNRSNYSYTDREVDKIFSEVRAETDFAEKRFRGASPKGSPAFTFEHSQNKTEAA